MSSAPLPICLVTSPLPATPSPQSSLTPPAPPATPSSTWAGEEPHLQRRSTTRRAYVRHPKPPQSYVELIAEALQSSPSGALTLAGITHFLRQQYPFFRGHYQGWRNSLRHNLSLNQCFRKILRDPRRPFGKDNLWTLDPRYLPRASSRRHSSPQPDAPPALTFLPGACPLQDSPSLTPSVTRSTESQKATVRTPRCLSPTERDWKPPLRFQPSGGFPGTKEMLAAILPSSYQQHRPAMTGSWTRQHSLNLRFGKESTKRTFEGMLYKTVDDISDQFNKSYCSFLPTSSGALPGASTTHLSSQLQHPASSAGLAPYPQFNQCPLLPSTRDYDAVVRPILFTDLQQRIKNQLSSTWGWPRLPRPPCSHLSPTSGETASDLSETLIKTVHRRPIDSPIVDHGPCYLGYCAECILGTDNHDNSSHKENDSTVRTRSHNFYCNYASTLGDVIPASVHSGTEEQFWFHVPTLNNSNVAKFSSRDDQVATRDQVHEIDRQQDVGRLGCSTRPTAALYDPRNSSHSVSKRYPDTQTYDCIDQLPSQHKHDAAVIANPSQKIPNVHTERSPKLKFGIEEILYSS